MPLASGEFPQYEPECPVDLRSWRVLEKGVKALGSVRAVKKIKSLTITIAYSTYEDKISYLAPDMVRRDSEFPWAKFRTAYNGNVTTRISGEEEEVVEEKGPTSACTWLMHRVDQTIIYPLIQSGNKVKYVGKSFLEDEPTEVIRVIYGDKWECRMHFFEKSGLVGRIEYRKDGKDPQRFLKEFDEYKKVGGIRLPHYLRSKNLLTGVVSEATPKYKVNPKFKPERFDLRTRAKKK